MNRMLILLLLTSCSKSREQKAEEAARIHLAKHAPECADQLEGWNLQITPNRAMDMWDIKQTHEDENRFLYVYRGTIKYTGRLCDTELEKPTNTSWYFNCKEGTWLVHGRLQGDMDWNVKAPHVVPEIDASEPALPIAPGAPAFQFSEFLEQACKPAHRRLQVREHRAGVDLDCYQEGWTCKKASLASVEALVSAITPTLASEGWPLPCFAARIVGGEGEKDAISVSLTGKGGLGSQHCLDFGAPVVKKDELSRIASKIKPLIAGRLFALGVDLLQVAGGDNEVRVRLK